MGGVELLVARGVAGTEEPVSMLEEVSRGRLLGTPYMPSAPEWCLEGLGNPLCHPQSLWGKAEWKKGMVRGLPAGGGAGQRRIPLGLWMSGSERVMYQTGTLRAQASQLLHSPPPRQALPFPQPHGLETQQGHCPKLPTSLWAMGRLWDAASPRARGEGRSVLASSVLPGWSAQQARTHSQGWGVSDLTVAFLWHQTAALKGAGGS